MSISNSIRLTLNIKDPNITFDTNCIHELQIKGVLSLVYSAKLSPPTPNACPHCGVVNQDFSIIKNGSKFVTVKMPRVSNRRTFLRLKKQRYLCKHCNHSFSAQTPLTEYRHSISKNTYMASLLDAKNKISIKDISRRHDISHGTLNHWIHQLNQHFKVNHKTLPKHLSFDEFSSVKSVHHKMSFIYMDASNGNVLDILQDRRLSFLKSYFFRFPLEVREQVETVCIDMYEPYIQLIRSCFPNAKIITDRFHIVQHINRALNYTRIHVMKHNPKYYARLKRYWKLILKDASSLDHHHYRKFTGYKYLMTESQVIDDLLRLSQEFESTYWLCQHLKQAIKHKNTTLLSDLMNRPNSHVAESMKGVLKTFKKQENYIINALTYPYSNGKLEGTNNLIKVIKRIAFGYRDFHNFRSRILLISNTMIHLEIKKPSSYFYDDGTDSKYVGLSHQH
ncbi:ISL3 family transposase [Erysipelothrix aquatica]|uniref:ISL3 family transposase n=2 Tax=Erysipelothrix aquatica TaxID=2683714 RepID=UPI00202CE7C0|nr:ISL3 family transposase [Erysipelothrix aquatica]